MCVCVCSSSRCVSFLEDFPDQKINNPASNHKIMAKWWLPKRMKAYRDTNGGQVKSSLHLWFFSPQFPLKKKSYNLRLSALSGGQQRPFCCRILLVLICFYWAIFGLNLNQLSYPGHVEKYEKMKIMRPVFLSCFKLIVPFIKKLIRLYLPTISSTGSWQPPKNPVIQPKVHKSHKTQLFNQTTQLFKQKQLQTTQLFNQRFHHHSFLQTCQCWGHPSSRWPIQAGEQSNRSWIFSGWAHWKNIVKLDHETPVIR